MLKYNNSKDLFEEWLSKARVQETINFINNYEFKNYLEIGGGNNPVYPFIKNFDTYELVDPELSSFKGGIPNESKLIIWVSAFENSFLQLKNSYDCVILNSVLHTVKDKDNFMKALLSVSSEETHIYINVPNIFSIHRIVGQILGINNCEDVSELSAKYGYYSGFSKNSLIKFLNGYGIKVISITSRFLKPFTNKQMSELFTTESLEKLTCLENEMTSKKLGCELIAICRRNNNDPL